MGRQLPYTLAHRYRESGRAVLSVPAHQDCGPGQVLDGSVPMTNRSDGLCSAVPVAVREAPLMSLLAAVLPSQIPTSSQPPPYCRTLRTRARRRGPPADADLHLRRRLRAARHQEPVVRRAGAVPGAGHGGGLRAGRPAHGGAWLAGGVLPHGGGRRRRGALIGWGVQGWRGCLWAWHTCADVGAGTCLNLARVACHRVSGAATPLTNCRLP